VNSLAERAFRPDLIGRPVMLSNDGCAIARSNEAKRCIAMGARGSRSGIWWSPMSWHLSANHLYGDCDG
jgi:hypothetical protein